MWDLESYVSNDALIDDCDNRISYRTLKEEGDRLYSMINTRCLIFSLCQNTIGSVLGYVSFLEHGIVPVLLSDRLDEELLGTLLDKYKPSFLWLPEKRVFEFADFEILYSAYGYMLLQTGYKEGYPLYGGLALLLTTSGSTGSPKFVRQSYGNIRANTESIVEYLALDSSERPITTLPMNYTYGLSVINTHLYVGATILLTDKGLMQKEFWEFLKKQAATSFGGVPYTYEILDRLCFYRMDLPQLQTMTQAGGKLTPELQEKFALFANESGKKFVVMYGQCEATARMGYLPPDQAVEKKGSMGIPVPGGKFKLINFDGEEILKPHRTGELVYEGDNVTLGYAECGEDLVKGDERHGILKTGDMAQFDEDGFYYIVGRKKRFLKIYGNRVNLDEMDRLIKGKYGIDVACTGIDDHMFIFLTDENMADEVKQFASSKTMLNPAAFHTIVIDKIPQNDSGKILYRELEQYYEM